MGTHAINPALYPKLRYDPLKDFVPVCLTHITPRVLVVGPSLPVTNLAELIARAKAKPGALTYGSAGNGESGLAGYEVSNWLGVLAPAHMPKAVIDRLNAALGQVMSDAALKQQLTALGIEPAHSSPDEFAALLRAELPKWADIVKKSGATAD